MIDPLASTSALEKAKQTFLSRYTCLERDLLRALLRLVREHCDEGDGQGDYEFNPVGGKAVYDALAELKIAGLVKPCESCDCGDKYIVIVTDLGKEMLP